MVSILIQSSQFEIMGIMPFTNVVIVLSNVGDARDSSRKKFTLSIQEFDKFGKIMTIPSSKINFAYRGTDLPNDIIFLSASFKGQRKSKKIIEQKMIELKEKKNKAQPIQLKTGGSTFKNPIKQTNKKVWELIRESVPLNTSIGDACISKKHCNFFVNKNNASFNDMKKLIDFVAECVEKKTGIKLEKEIKILE